MGKQYEGRKNINKLIGEYIPSKNIKHKISGTRKVLCKSLVKKKRRDLEWETCC